MVAYFSKATPIHKRDWGQTKLEFECLYTAVTHYLYNCNFHVFTDCKSLLNWQTIFSKNNPTMIRKLQELSTLRFTIRHISGKENAVADFLSRYPHRKTFINRETQTDSDVLVNTVISSTPDCNLYTPLINQHNTTSAPSLIPATLKLKEFPLPDQVLNSNSQEGTVFHTLKMESKDDSSLIPEIPTLDKATLSLEYQESTSSPQINEVVNTASTDSPHQSFCICSIPEKTIDHQTHKISEDHTPSSSDIINAVQQNNITFPDRNTIRSEQKKDPIISEVISWVQSGERPKIQVNRAPAALSSLWKQFNLLSFEDEILLRKWVDIKDPNTSRSLIIVPDSITEQIMQTFHKSLLNCHPGVEKTLHQCRQFFYWPKMKEDFSDYITACTTCQETKQPHRFLRAPLKHLIFHHFNDCIVADHIVPETEGRTPRGFRYILSITDCFSNYLVAVPVKSQTSQENIKAIFRNWVLTFGTPKELIVDNHPGFTSEFFTKVFEAFDCKKTHGTAYKSRSTGRAENSNKRLNQALRAIIPKGKERDWDVYLSYATFALNCLNNSRTGFSANRMVFGTELNTPLSVLIEDSDSFKPTEVDKRSQEAYKLRNTMKTVIRKVRENSNNHFMYAKNFHDRNVMGPFFKMHDLCYILIECPSHKFGSRWRGPFLITDVINDHLYKVQLAPGKEKITNISKMKHYEKNKYSVEPITNQSTPSTNITSAANNTPPNNTSVPDFITIHGRIQTNQPLSLIDKKLPPSDCPTRPTSTPHSIIHNSTYNPIDPQASSSLPASGTSQSSPSAYTLKAGDIDDNPVTPNIHHSQVSDNSSNTPITPGPAASPINNSSTLTSSTPLPLPDETPLPPQEPRPHRSRRSPLRYLGYILGITSRRAR